MQTRDFVLDDLPPIIYTGYSHRGNSKWNFRSGGIFTPTLTFCKIRLKPDYNVRTTDKTVTMEVIRSTLQLIECNIDDMNPELFPYVIEQLLNAGAKDAWVTPIVMKKGRPAQCLSTLCEQQLHTIISDILFRETTTLGLRTTTVEREELKRSHISVPTRFGLIRMKVGYGENGEVLNAAPEYEDCRIAAEQHSVALKTVYQVASESFAQSKISPAA